MTKLACVECQVEYKLVKSGNPVIEMFQNPPVPYKILNGDRWECPSCYHQIIAGFGQTPLAEHFQPDFQEMLQRVLEDDNTIYCYEEGK